MKHQSVFSFSLLILFLCFTKGLTQSPAQAPAGPVATQPPPTTAASPPMQVPVTPGSTNVTKILEKAGRYTIFIRLLKSTAEEGHLISELNDTNKGLTIFAPTDGAFAGLGNGILNTLSDEDKSKLVKFHIIPTYLSTTQFQTVSNPIATEAGTGPRESMNVTAYPNSVNITTGRTNTSISGTVYTDNQLAIYRLDQVLLPMPNSTALAPAPVAEKPKKKAPAAETAPAAVVPVDTSSGEKYINRLGFFGLCAASLVFASCFGW